MAPPVGMHNFKKHSRVIETQKRQTISSSLSLDNDRVWSCHGRGVDGVDAIDGGHGDAGVTLGPVIHPVGRGRARGVVR